MKFPLQQISTSHFFSKPIDQRDLGAIGRGLFTKKAVIEICTLAPRQTQVDGGTLNLKLTGKHLTVPCVVICKDGNILIDGHHTVIAKKLNGQKAIKAAVYYFNN